MMTDDECSWQFNGLLDDSLDEAVADAERGRGELVGDGRVDGRIVQRIIALVGSQRSQLEGRHQVLTC